MSNKDRILSEALALKPVEKLELIDEILASFYPINKGVEVLWNNEAEERINTYINGSLPAIDGEATFSKYKK